MDIFLRDNGFRIFELDRALSRRRNLNATLFSKREIIWAHALYLKEPIDILDAFHSMHAENPETKDGRTICLQLLLLALAYDYIDFAEEIIGVMIQHNMLSAADGAALLLEVESYARRRTFKVWFKLKKFPRKEKTFDLIHKDRNYRFRTK